jgi:non-heme chloroperoxidase
VFAPDGARKIRACRNRKSTVRFDRNAALTLDGAAAHALPSRPSQKGNPFLLKTGDNPEGVDKSVFDGMLAGVRQDRIAFLQNFFPAFYNLQPGQSEDLLAFSKWIAWAASPLATEQCIVAFGETDFRADLAKFDIPTLVAHGDADQIVPLAVSGQRSHALIAGSRLEVVQGAPHGFAATHAQQLNTLLLDFLKA